MLSTIRSNSVEQSLVTTEKEDFHFDEMKNWIIISIQCLGKVKWTHFNHFNVTFKAFESSKLNLHSSEFEYVKQSNRVEEEA